MAAPDVARPFRIEVGRWLDVTAAKSAIADPLVNEPARFVLGVPEMHQVAPIRGLEDGVAGFRAMREQVHEPAIAGIFECAIADPRVTAMCAEEGVIESPRDRVQRVQAAVLKYTEEFTREQHLVQANHFREGQPTPAQSERAFEVVARKLQD